MHITVGIGARLLESGDGGLSWTEGVRVIPPPTEPRIHGAREGLGLPAPAGCDMSDVHIGVDGIGLAAGCEPVANGGGRSSIARFWLTRDGGASWQAIQPDIGFLGRLRAWPSWPPEEVDSVEVLAGGLMAFAWEDPWLHEGPKSHIALSADGGDRWRYVRLRIGYNALACGPGPLRILGGGRITEWSGARSFRRESIRLEWDLPPGYWNDPVPLRFVRFTSEADGLALVVSWPRDDPPRTPEELPPPLVGLARSHDGGRRWKVVSTWEGPRSTDLNRRHEITLVVL